MNPLDILIIVIASFTLIRGFFRGLVKELSSIIGVFGGFYASYTYYPYVARLISRWIHHPGYLGLVSFMTIFCAVFLSISIAGVLIKYLLDIADLGSFDRILGASFGFLKGFLIIVVLLIGLTAFLPKKSPILTRSLLAPHVAVFAEKMATIASRDLKHQFLDRIKDLKKHWQTTT